jgi:hypothetical protein
VQFVAIVAGVVALIVSYPAFSYWRGLLLEGDRDTGFMTVVFTGLAAVAWLFVSPSRGTLSSQIRAGNALR